MSNVILNMLGNVVLDLFDLTLGYNIKQLIVKGLCCYVFV